MLKDGVESNNLHTSVISISQTFILIEISRKYCTKLFKFIISHRIIVIPLLYSAYFLFQQDDSEVKRKKCN